MIKKLVHRLSLVKAVVDTFFIILLLPVVDVFAEQSNATECYCLRQLKSGLRNPVHMEATVIDGKDVFLIGEQRGIIHKFDPETRDLEIYIDLRDEIVSSPDPFDERGLLGFALHPNFSTNRQLYTYSIRGVSGQDYVAVSAIKNKNLAEEKLLMMIAQPGSRRNGGQLLFGTDGYLYIFVGDGGPAQVYGSDAQNTSTLLGKILRVDIDDTTVVANKMQYYTVPEDNPRKPGWRQEIYALGVRNMWRCSIDAGDPVTGDGKGRIFCGELGSEIADELNLITKGSNYGWHYREGLNCLEETKCKEIEADEVFPIYVFNRTDSGMNAVVGGPLYRGKIFPSLQGHLLYGDYVTGHISSIKLLKPNDWVESQFKACSAELCGCDARAIPPNHLLSFGQDKHGEMYLLMTDVPSTTEPHGDILKMLLSQSSQTVTCGFPRFCLSLHLLWICLTICCWSKR